MHPPSRTARQMAGAARAWLDALTVEQRAIAHWSAPAYDDPRDSERRRWFYTPTDHGGLTMHQQGPAQQRAAMRLVAAGLSLAGYVTVATTMGLENVLDRVEGFAVDFDRERGRDPGLYYLRIFGEPGTDAPWGWRFGGHHVSLNNLVVGGQLVSTTPCFMGASPASVPLLGGTVGRALGRVEDLGRELVRSLTPQLLARAVLPGKAPADILTANRSSVSEGELTVPPPNLWRGGRSEDEVAAVRAKNRGTASDEATGLAPAEHRSLEDTAAAKGLPGRDLDRTQRELLLSLLGTYFGRVPDSVSPLASYDDRALDEVHFAWSGSIEPGSPHYYRLQGPRLLIEWDNVQNGANHAHSVWRDPEADFGLDVLARHRTQHH